MALLRLSTKQAVGGRPPQYAPPPVTLTFDLLTLKVVSESRVTWAISVPIILVFLGLSVLDIGPMYATDRRQTDVRQHHCLMPPPRGAGHNNEISRRIAIIFVRQMTTSICRGYGKRR